MTLALLVAGVGGTNAQVAFAFDAFGKASVAKGSLVAAEGLSYDTSTGVLTSNGTAGTLTLEFAAPVDLRNLFHFNVVRNGAPGADNIVNRLRFYDEDNALINTWNSIKWSNTWNPSGIDDNATNAFLNHKPVKKLVWESDADAANAEKTLTITSVDFTCKTIACSKAGETQLKTLAWNKIDNSGTAIPDWNMNGSSDTYYGNFSGDPTHYADLTAYSTLRVYCKDENTGFRCFFINQAGTGINQIHTNDASWNAEEKYYSLDLSKIEKWNGKVALKAMKAENGGGPGERYVTNIVVYNTPAANAPKYLLTGSGMHLSETVAALADANATSIDATGVTGITTNSEAGRTLLTSANPNCLFLGTTGNGGLANTKNVITSDKVCANLELTDEKPFNAPVAFTATSAKFTKTMNADYGTMVIPFTATVPEGVEAYEITASNGEVLTTNKVEEITANKPVMLKGSGNVFTASGAAIAATAEGVQTNGLLSGVYTATAVPTENTYVLQKQVEDVNFYKAISGLTVNPFRAYLTTAAGAARLTFDFNEATGIKTVKTTEGTEVYNLQGVRVANPTKGLYIVNGKKVIK